ncbi:Mur ligase family protein, partial [Hydrogenivirga sp. 128-5-R1-1]|uniref:Mur ligase family protein n=1 Tax=Hydrogenivirga sp. 128-5-R1-1 TaxID=392423 RepID=UPI00015F1C3A
MNLHQIANITGAKFKNLSNKKVNRFIIDSRQAKKGDFFVPLKGNNVDGHQFIDEVFKKGAFGSFSSKNIEKSNVLVVDDTLKALTDIAKYKKDFIDIKIGITGTAGKTTTKEILSYLLSYFYPVYYTKGNYNNQIGLPITLANIDKNYRYGVFELGASKKGDISYLTDILNQNIAVITNVGYGHTEGLGGFEGVLQEKKNILKTADFKIAPKWLNINEKNIKTFGYENADTNINSVY